ncbi:hypothetical protein ABWJ92_36300 [Streptomyces sp. NPDC000609]|uniref:hypothetical protein n=1 Tax=Streptomyces sp. NPDC000609 TaxID=3160957 RepID=UPI0033981D08
MAPMLCPEAVPTVGVEADALDLFGRPTADLGMWLLQLGFRDQFRAAAGALERATVVRAPHRAAAVGGMGFDEFPRAHC